MTQYHLHLKGYVGGADFNTESVLATLAANPDAEGSVPLTEAQLQILEDHVMAQETRINEQQTRITAQEAQLTERNNRITELEAEVKALKGVPAAESSAVVNAQTGEGQQPTNKANEYLANLNSAKELYDMVS